MIGDILPADLLLVDSNGIKMDVSSLTVESETLSKDIYEKCVEYIKNNRIEDFGFNKVLLNLFLLSVLMLGSYLKI